MPSVEALAIGSRIAPNSKLCRPSRSATLAARTTWPTAPWTSEPFIIPLLPKRLVQDTSHVHTSQPSRQEASLLSPAGLGSPGPSELLFLFSSPDAIKAQSLFLDQFFLSVTPCPLGTAQASTSSTTLKQDVHLSELPACYRTIWAQGNWSKMPDNSGATVGSHREMVCPWFPCLSDIAISVSLPVMAPGLLPPCASSQPEVLCSIC